MSQSTLRDLVEFDTNNTKLAQYIADVLASPEKLDAIAKRSYRHVAGFVKIILDYDDTYTMRAHFWRKYDLMADTQNPHSHGWKLTSKILKGRFDNIMYSETPESTALGAIQRNKYATELTIHNKSCNFTPMTPTNLLNTETYTYAPGNVYSMTRAEIHKFVSLEDGGITLSIRERDHDDISFIYAKADRPLPTSQTFPILTPAEVAEYLRQIYDNATQCV